MANQLVNMIKKMIPTGGTRWLPSAGTTTKHVVGKRRTALRKGAILLNSRTRRPSSMPTYTEIDRMITIATLHEMPKALAVLKEYRIASEKKHKWRTAYQALLGEGFTSFGYTRGMVR